VSQTGPSGHRAAAGRSWPQRAQTLVARGVHVLQTGLPPSAKLHGRRRPQAVHRAYGIR